MCVNLDAHNVHGDDHPSLWESVKETFSSTVARIRDYVLYGDGSQFRSSQGRSAPLPPAEKIIEDLGQLASIKISEVIPTDDKLVESILLERHLFRYEKLEQNRLLKDFEDLVFQEFGNDEMEPVLKALAKSSYQEIQRGFQELQALSSAKLQNKLAEERALFSQEKERQKVIVEQLQKFLLDYYDDEKEYVIVG